MGEPQKCAQCLKPVPPEAAFCPFCGAELARVSIDDTVRAELNSIKDEDDPVKRRELIEAALGRRPDSLPLLTEKLHLGRLYERGKRTLDFSVIKCYLLQLYHKPEELSADMRDAMRGELFGDPVLKRCLELAPDKSAFLLKYLTRLAREFAHIFLRGDNGIMRTFMGFRMESRAAKLLAPYVARMIRRVNADGLLTPEQRELLVAALRTAYSGEAEGDTRLLDEALLKE